MNEKIDIVLARYFSGEASHEELNELDKWLSESAENEAYFDDMTMLYQKTASLSEYPIFNTEDALVDFKAYVHDSQKRSVPKKSFRLNRYYLGIAASIIIFIGIFSVIFLSKDQETIQYLASSDISLEYDLSKNIHIILAPDSKVEYDVNDNTRIKLTGEATFSVEAGKEEKLVVQAGEVFVKHIGTVFTVSAYEMNDFIQVEVHEGQVHFYSTDNEGIFIHENESGIYHIGLRKFEYFSNEQVQDIVFNALTLNEVVLILEENFNTPIQVAPEIKSMRISVTFDSGETLENILEIIAETLSLTLSNNEQYYSLSL